MIITAMMYQVMSLVLHAGHRVLAQPARLPHFGHLILLSPNSVFLKIFKRNAIGAGGTLPYREPISAGPQFSVAVKLRIRTGSGGDPLLALRLSTEVFRQ